jgi:hypothetical protein
MTKLPESWIQLIKEATRTGDYSIEEGFDDGEFYSVVVDEARNHYKHQLFNVEFVHRTWVDGEDVYFKLIGTTDPDEGLRIVDLVYVEPTTVTKTVYKHKDRI